MAIYMLITNFVCKTRTAPRPYLHVTRTMSSLCNTIFPETFTQDKSFCGQKCLANNIFRTKTDFRQFSPPKYDRLSLFWRDFF